MKYRGDFFGGVHYPPMDRASVQLLEKAQARLIDSVSESFDGAVNADALVEALKQVLPRIPGLVETRLPKAHAQIYTQAQMQSLLALFAIDILRVQAEAVRRVDAQRTGGAR